MDTQLQNPGGGSRFESRYEYDMYIFCYTNGIFAKSLIFTLLVAMATDRQIYQKKIAEKKIHGLLIFVLKFGNADMKIIKVIKLLYCKLCFGTPCILED